MLNLTIGQRATRKLKKELLDIRGKYIYDTREKSKDVLDEYRNEAMPLINELNKRIGKTWEDNGRIGNEPVRITFKDFVQK